MSSDCYEPEALRVDLVLVRPNHRCAHGELMNVTQHPVALFCPRRGDLAYNGSAYPKWYLLPKLVRRRLARHEDQIFAFLGTLGRLTRLSLPPKCGLHLATLASGDIFIGIGGDFVIVRRATANAPSSAPTTNISAAAK